MTQDRQTVDAHVVLKTKLDALPSGTRLSASNIHDIFADPATREQVRRRLEEYHFTVRDVSEQSVLVSAPPDLLERVFQAKLGRSRGMNGRWQWLTPPVIPPDLHDVEQVVLPEPMRTDSGFLLTA